VPTLLMSEIYAQKELNDIDFNQIKQKKVRQFIRQIQDHRIDFFSDLEASVESDDTLDFFINYEKEYIVKEQADLVWDSYIYSSQTDIWDNHRVSFGLLYSAKSESIIYADQYYFGIEEGQIFFLNLRILNGLVKLPVAFKILRVDPVQRVIEFSYLSGGKASGIQIISMQETEEGFVRIAHKSYVKSDSNFRDKYLYPYFHTKIINEFHQNMKKMIAYRAKSSSALTELK
jgi:hypothetical protein